MSALPLDGIRVLDASNTYAGPTCGRVLADLGAEVIHLEAMQRYDGVRRLIMAENDPAEHWWNRGAYFAQRNLGKQSLTLDLTRPEGITLFKRVAAECDIVLESFAPRVMRRFGLTYDDLRQDHERLIYCSLSGYGQDGPYRDWIAYGMGLEGASGIAAATGYAGGPPVRAGISLTDPLCGLAAAAAVLMALRYRRRTGLGQHIDLSEHEMAIALAGDALLDYQMNGREPERRGNRSWFAAPQGCYPCRSGVTGDDGWVALSCHTDAEFERLCRATGHPEWLEDERFADLLARHEHHDALDQAIGGWTRQRTKHEAMAALQAHEVRAAAVLHGKDLLFNEHLRARDHYDRVDHAEVGQRLYPRQLPVQFSSFTAKARGPAPLLGEHTDDVLTRLAGLSPDELAALRAEQVIGDHPEPPLPPELVRQALVHPLGVWLEAGAVAAVDSDYRAQLGLE